jgi:hypothetical protein
MKKQENKFEGIMAVAGALVFISMLFMGMTDRVAHPIAFYSWVVVGLLSFATIGRVAYLEENKKR